MTPVYAEADGEVAARTKRGMIYCAWAVGQDQFMLYATHEKVLGLVWAPKFPRHL